MTDSDSFADDVRAIAADFDGALGLAATNLLNGETLAYNADRSFSLASVIKLVVMLEALRRVQRGELDLDARHRLGQDTRTKGSGVLKDLDDGLALTLRDLLTLMIAQSDNVATNMLLDLVGVDAVTRLARRLDMPGTVLHRRITFQDGLGPLAEGTPTEFCRLLERLARRELLTPALSDLALTILERQQFQDMIPRELPYDPYLARWGPPGEHLTVASKSGWVQGVRNDVGIVRGPGVFYALALFSEGASDARRSADNRGVLAVARLSRLVYDHFTAT